MYSEEEERLAESKVAQDAAFIIVRFAAFVIPNEVRDLGSARSSKDPDSSLRSE